MMADVLIEVNIKPVLGITESRDQWDTLQQELKNLITKIYI